MPKGRGLLKDHRFYKQDPFLKSLLYMLFWRTQVSGLSGPAILLPIHRFFVGFRALSVLVAEKVWDEGLL